MYEYQGMFLMNIQNSQRCITVSSIIFNRILVFLLPPVNWKNSLNFTKINFMSFMFLRLVLKVVFDFTEWYIFSTQFQKQREITRKISISKEMFHFIFIKCQELHQKLKTPSPIQYFEARIWYFLWKWTQHRHIQTSTSNDDDYLCYTHSSLTDEVWVSGSTKNVMILETFCNPSF